MQIEYRPVGRLRFFLGVLAFWGMVFLVFCVQLAWGSEQDLLRKGLARWVLLEGLAMFFSAMDYAIPSYRRHVSLSERGAWGARAKIITRH